MNTPKKFLSVLLWSICDELEKQFGAPPRASIEQVKAVAKGYVERFHLPGEAEILAELNAQIDKAFGGEAVAQND